MRTFGPMLFDMELLLRNSRKKITGIELATRDEISRSNRWFTIGRPLTVWLQEMRTIRAVGKIFHTEIAKITKICCTTGKSSGTQS